MPRTAQKVDELAEEGEHMTDALQAVLSVAEEQGSVTWSDVSDEITSGEWGRLIETGMLTDADGEGFVIEDPDGIREALDEADPADLSDQDTSWTTYDKLAAVTAVGMFAGYAFDSARQAIGSTIDILVGPLNDLLPFYVVILVLAVMTGLASAIFQDNLGNTEVMSDYREQTEKLKERREKAKERGDDEALEQIQQEQMEMMSENLGVFKAQFRPMVWIMLFTIPVFLWLYWMTIDVGVGGSSPALVLPIAGEISSWRTKLVGPMEVWIVWYFVCSLGFGQIMRKALNVQTTPG
ncbi:DUF106 domain-containing protein [Halovenus sp. WSH3]|uniref:DUF106 domain-containing protein n=1 Tax=Halovenus carboxidivorans TaxID=2692199 RepID=A0A6B0T8F4_9EURY|nr:DUF106 domain-containing protein [Halovenus carboxidivorans]MXR51120.1 DUF106 domain-containing protein [Halovenus carboxidivorans]